MVIVVGLGLLIGIFVPRERVGVVVAWRGLYPIILHENSSRDGLSISSLRKVR